MEAKGDTKQITIPFPDVDDYAKTQSEKFNWNYNWLDGSARKYSQRIGVVLSGMAASTYGYKLDCDIKALQQVGVDKKVIERKYILNYKDAKYEKNQVGYTIGYKDVKTLRPLFSC